ncbi:MAG: hypothetical protein QOH82_1, partial [Mycobacterium sp.]|nr:hypothetical protein [Mycobacterium sp.]
MCGVAEEEDAATPPVVGNLRAECVLADAHQFELIDAGILDPWLDQRAECIEGAEVGGRLVVEQTELPPVARLADA